jgi:hypothetical protein
VRIGLANKLVAVTGGAGFISARYLVTHNCMIGRSVGKNANIRALELLNISYSSLLN